MRDSKKTSKTALIAQNGKDTAGQFLQGAVIPFRAFKLLFKRSEYWSYIAVPVFINLVIYIVFGLIMIYWIMPALGDMVPHSASNRFILWTYAILRILIRITAFIAFTAIFLFTFTVLFFLVATPFLDSLSVKLEKDDYNFDFDGGGATQMAKDVIMSMKNSIRMSLASIFWTVVFLPLNFFVPVVGFIPGLLLGSYFLGLSFIMFSFEHRRLPYKEIKKLLKNRRTAVLGFGLTVYGVLLVPFSAIIFLPIAVMGGTILFNEKLLRGDEKT